MKKLHSGVFLTAEVAGVRSEKPRLGASVLVLPGMKRIDTIHAEGRIETSPIAVPTNVIHDPWDRVSMHSLYYVLTDQHRDDFAPIRCSEQTISRLVRCFEDVVIENKLSALVIEGRCLNGERSRESKRLRELAAAARRVYLFSCDSECESRSWEPEACSTLTTLAERGHHNLETGPFILVMEPRFSGLLASCVLPDPDDNQKNAHEMIWTFDPNVLFTAIEYVLARISAQTPKERERFEAMLNACTPRSSSPRLALSFTTKVTMLMQHQNELEMATNHISSAISGTLEIEEILQSAVEEVGRALDARRAALVLWQEGSNLPEGMSVYERPQTLRATADELTALVSKSAESSPNGQKADNQAVTQCARSNETPRPPKGDENENAQSTPTTLEIPISYRDTVIGVLVVEDDTLRDWEDEEILMLKTVADQLSVAISHARLFRHVQNQAMTDALTGLYNHRYFQDRLNRETRLADRNNEEVSLILLDLDRLKNINDTHGHRSGDAALLHVASFMKSVVRNVDVCARYGGEEFVVILPQCTRESAFVVAERLREAIASTPVQRVGQVTASIGVATYPSGAKTREELVEMADRAMYLAKAAGRNRVRVLAHRSYTGTDAR